MNIFKSALQVLSTGYIFVYFSEHLFWARVRPDDSFGGWFGAWIAYSLMAFIFLHLVTYFHVRNIWALFLAGAAFGWIGEGIVVQTAYEMLPLSISFTGLAWHALITVWVGWYAVRKSLIEPDRLSTLKLASILGFFYGLWAISWWVEPDGGISSIWEFATFSLGTTGIVIIAYWLSNWSSTESLVFPRPISFLIYALVVIYFCFVTVPAAPVALLILPVLFGAVYWGLYKNRIREREGSVLNTLSGPVPGWKYFTLLALPVTGILLYAVAVALDLQWYTNWILYLITTPLGFILLGLSLYKLAHSKSTTSEPELDITH